MPTPDCPNAITEFQIRSLIAEHGRSLGHMLDLETYATFDAARLASSLSTWLISHPVVAAEVIASGYDVSIEAAAQLDIIRQVLMLGAIIQSTIEHHGLAELLRFATEELAPHSAPNFSGGNH